jgi:hypothetical protein
LTEYIYFYFKSNNKEKKGKIILENGDAAVLVYDYGVKREMMSKKKERKT